MNHPKVAVVGSANVDMVIRSERIPDKGETIFGDSFDIFTGGKGFNQATAAARLGADVTFIGKVGDDNFGQMLRDAMSSENINTQHVTTDKDVGTGIASIFVDSDGENSIIVIPRANMCIAISEIDKAAESISQAEILLLQLETPIDASIRATEIAKESNTPVILDPAPAKPLPKQFLSQVDILTPNTAEAEHLSGIATNTIDSCIDAGKVLLQHLSQDKFSAVVMTLGNKGVLVVTHSQTEHIPAVAVNAVDTTGAGDAFTGALATSIAKSNTLIDSVQYANTAGAAAVTVLGATPSMPYPSKIESLMTL
ncbi:ribokinase [Candidatus Poribacteria bacterium]|nr:MAG: ribokinase [Candidatus Poribacteria bacterium]